jgi:hypothetical protein
MFSETELNLIKSQWHTLEEAYPNKYMIEIASVDNVLYISQDNKIRMRKCLNDVNANMLRNAYGRVINCPMYRIINNISQSLGTYIIYKHGYEPNLTKPEYQLTEKERGLLSKVLQIDVDAIKNNIILDHIFEFKIITIDNENQLTKVINDVQNLKEDMTAIKNELELLKEQMNTMCKYILNKPN